MNRKPIPKPWQRSTKRRPCAVCGGSGCLRAGPHDSPSAVVCARIKSGRKVGTIGFLHVLSDNGPTWTAWRVSLKRLEKSEVCDE